MRIILPVNNCRFVYLLLQCNFFSRADTKIYQLSFMTIGSALLLFGFLVPGVYSMCLQTAVASGSNECPKPSNRNSSALLFSCFSFSE